MLSVDYRTMKGPEGHGLRSAIAMASCLLLASQAVPAAEGAQTPSSATGRTDALAPAPAAAGTQACTLGTAGTPGAVTERAGESTLIVVDGHRYLVDAGTGLARQLAAMKVRESEIPVVFLSHLHDDHTASLVELMSIAYTTRTTGMSIVGPPRTKALVDGALQVMQVNAELRQVENTVKGPPEPLFKALEVVPGLVYKDDWVEVTAAENAHFHMPAGTLAARNRSYSYRFKTRDRTIVVTGDTGPSDAVLDLAKNADLLISEVLSPEAEVGVPPEILARIRREHLTPEQVAQLGTTAGVKKIVLTHLRRFPDSRIEDVRRGFRGEALVGRDLQCY